MDIKHLQRPFAELDHTITVAKGNLNKWLRYAASKTLIQ